MKKEVLDKEKLVKLIKMKGIRSLSALSRKAGLSDGTITNALSSNEGRVNASTARNIALLLGVDVSDVLIDKPAPEPEKEPEKEETKPDGAFLQRQLTLRELKLQTELLQKIYDLLK